MEENRPKRTSEKENNQTMGKIETVKEHQQERLEREEKEESGWMTNMSYQYSLDKFRKCKDCQTEKETIEEMELNIKKIQKLSHEILLLQNDLVDQCILVEVVHAEHKGKKMLIIDTEKASKNRGNTQRKLIEEETSAT